MNLQRKNPFLNHNEEEKTFHLLEQGDELTQMKAITVLVDESEDSRLCDQFFAKVKPQTDYLAKRLKMTALQAIIFSIILEHEGICSLSNMSRHLDCLNITMLRCKAEIDKLVCRHYLRLEKIAYGRKVFECRILRYTYESVSCYKQHAKVDGNQLDTYYCSDILFPIPAKHPFK